MDNASYVSLARQSGLMRELSTIANNIANINTNGYRREGSVFAEHVKALDGGDPSLSIATMTHRFVDFSAGDIQTTDNPLDVAIEGEAFFLVDNGNGERLTRDGALSLNTEGELVTSTNARVLDNAGGPIAVPPQAQSITISEDGSIFADGQAVGQIGLVTADPAYMVREGSNLFRPEQGYEPAEGARIHQNSLESSNVNAVEEIARLIEVQRTYESGLQFIRDENERIRQTIREIGQRQ